MGSYCDTNAAAVGVVFRVRFRGSRQKQIPRYARNDNWV